MCHTRHTTAKRKHSMLDEDATRPGSLIYSCGLVELPHFVNRTTIRSIVVVLISSLCFVLLDVCSDFDVRMSRCR